MDDKQVKRIPYGVSDYEKIVENNYYYIDKTNYLPLVEKAGDYLFFIRPRRFGKSLFLSMMRAYYDVLYKDQFEKFFKGTMIYDNPTPERGQYLVLWLNFSGVDPAMDKLERSFLALVRDNATAFIREYRSPATESEAADQYYKSIQKSRSATDILGHLIRFVKELGQKMYIIIDEYDNFTNTILTASGDKAYHALTHEDGFLRSFFNVLKTGTGGTGAPISRLFITGVSPVTMDDVTSGFNIGENVSQDLNLNRMLGFTIEEVTQMIDYYRRAGNISMPTDELTKLMTEWYGNYTFCADDAAGLFNSDMVLYFLKNYMKQQKLPDNLIDRNVRIDYGKLRHLIIMDKGKNKPPVTNGNFSKLKQIMETGTALSKISDGFPLAQMTETNNFISLLYYFGLLTIQGRERDRYRLQIPNETIKRLYFNYMEEAYKETGVFSLDLDKYANLMSDMAYDGAWRPLLTFITARIKESMALRDLMNGEKAVQTFLYVYLGLSDLLVVHSEKEMNKGFVDLLLLPLTAKYPELKYAFLLELKYLKSGLSPDDRRVKQLAAEAETQLAGYGADEKFLKLLGNDTKVIPLVLIFSGHEAVYIEEATLRQTTD